MDLKLNVDGKDHSVQAQIINNTLWVYHNGRVLTADANTGRKSRKKSGAAGSSDQIISPMPGKVTKLLLKEGAEVAVGQAVLVMEAMKMEYTLKSDIAGKIESIECAVNDQVALGKTLVRITPTVAAKAEK